MPYAARSTDQRVGMAARPEKPVEERLVDQVRKQAAEDEPPWREAFAQAEQHARTDADMTEDEQRVALPARLKVEAGREHAGRRCLVALLRLRHAGQCLELERAGHHPRPRRSGGQVIVAAPRCRRRTRLVLDLRLQAAVDARTDRLVEAPAGERLGLHVPALLPAGLDPEHPVQDQLESSESPPGSEAELHLSPVGMEADGLETDSAGQIDAVGKLVQELIAYARRGALGADLEVGADVPVEVGDRRPTDAAREAR